MRFRLFFLFLTLSLAVTACGPRRRTWTPNADLSATTSGSGTVTANAQLASGSPAEQAAQLDQIMTGQGFVQLGTVQRSTLATGGLTAYAVDAQPGHCYTVAVIGEAQAQNVDLVVIDPYGRPAAHDVRPDGHPWASFCSSSFGRFIARIQMTAGSGSFVYAAYQGSAGQRMDLSPFFGAPAAGSDTRTAQMDAAVESRLGQLDQRLAQRGYSRVGQATGLVIGAGQLRDFQLNLQPGQCYAFASLGSDQVGQTELILVDGGGQQLVRGGGDGPDAQIEYCAPADGSYHLQVRVGAGEGGVFTAGYIRAASGSASQQAVLERDSTAGADLLENFALVDADMRARGYERFGETEEGQLATGAETAYSIPLEGGLCYALLAVGDAGVTDLDLALLAPDGSEVDRDVAVDPRPTVRVCARTSGRYEMRVRVAAGRGRYVYASYRWPRGTQGPFGMEGITWVRMSEVTALLNVEGYAPDPGFTPGEGNLGSEGSTASHDVELTAGQCYAVVVVGGEGVRDLDVSLTRNGAELRTDLGSRHAFPSVRYCADTDGAYRITVTAAQGRGEYHYQIFSRSDGS